MNLMFGSKMLKKIVHAKTVVLGDPGVGKSAIVQMSTSDEKNFPKNYNMTLGVELGHKRCNLPDSPNSVNMLIYDCGGLDIYVDSLTQHWDQPDLLMVVCDVTAPHTLQSVADWHRVAQSAEWAGGRPAPVASILFANKADLTQRRLISAETASQLATKYGFHYVEGSAKDNEGVQQAFEWLTEQLFREVRYSQSVVKPSYGVSQNSILRSTLSNSSLK